MALVSAAVAVVAAAAPSPAGATAVAAAPNRAEAAVPAAVLAPRAHEVPADVTVQMYFVPRGETLTLLVRVPFASMRDMDFPVRGPGYLDLPGVRPLLEDAAVLWIADYLTIYEDGEPLGPERFVRARITLPSDRSYRSFEEALALVSGPRLPDATQIVPGQALIDVHFEVPITSDEARFSVDPALAHLGLETLSVVHFHPPDGAEHVFQYAGNPGIVRLDPTWYQVGVTFVVMGFFHILDGIDHLLFILCLVIPFRQLRGLVPIVTGFTVAHSITLIAAALGMAPRGLWFPPLVETLIAVSIVYMALENILGSRLHRRWLVAFGFGLIHGFGFSFALQEALQFAGGHLLTSLLAFNVGVELGQIFVLVLLVPVLDWGLRRLPSARAGEIVLSALVAHTAWHWMAERWGQLVQYRVVWPGWSTEMAGVLVRWLLLAGLCVAAAWAMAALFGRWWSPPVEEGLDPHVT